MDCIYFETVFNESCLQISCDAKYFPSLVQDIVIGINNCYSMLFSNLNKKQTNKQNTALLSVELLAVTWVHICILRHPI